jgi:hypothetical protein
MRHFSVMTKSFPLLLQYFVWFSDMNCQQAQRWETKFDLGTTTFQ